MQDYAKLLKEMYVFLGVAGVEMRLFIFFSVLKSQQGQIFGFFWFVFPKIRSLRLVADNVL